MDRHIAPASLVWKISIGFFFGIIFGFIIAPIFRDSQVLSVYVMPFIDLIGKIFLSLLMMLTVLLVFSSLVAGVASLDDPKKLGRIGIKTLALFFITTEIAIVFGMIFGNLFKPGSKISIPTNIDMPVSVNSMSEFFIELFPTNPIASMANADMLQIIVFATLIGAACIVAGEVGKKIAGFFDDFSLVMYSLTYIVMRFAPFGVFALISVTAARYGLTILAPFTKVIAAVYIGCIVHAVIVYSLMMILFCRRSPKWFFKNVRDIAITGFVTRSSLATLPFALAEVRNKLGVSEKITSFVLPLGVTINMDGTALYQTVCTLFVARAFNIPVTFAMQLEIFFFATLASIGTAGIPGAGLVMLTMLLRSVGLPLEGIALVAGIDVILNAARTCVNIVGNAAVCAVVAVSEGETLTA